MSERRETLGLKMGREGIRAEAFDTLLRALPLYHIDARFSKMPQTRKVEAGAPRRSTLLFILAPNGRTS